MVQALQGSSIEERLAYLSELESKASSRVLTKYRSRMDLAWIYHDSALEGVVYSPEELRAVMNEVPPDDPALVPVFDEIRNHQLAIDAIRDMSTKRSSVVTLDDIKKLFAILAPEELEGKGPPKYRKDMPVHRLYFHEIAEPDKISYRMRQIVQWANDPETQKAVHPMRLASRLHYQMLHVYPFPRHSGKVARLTMNLVLLRSDLPPVVIHSTERHRYYEALKSSEDATAQLVSQAMVASTESAIQFFEEA